MKPINFETHCSTEHNTDAKRCCVWCKPDQIRHTWPKGRKLYNADHLIACFESFETSIRISSRPAICKLPSAAASAIDTERPDDDEENDDDDEQRPPQATRRPPYVPSLESRHVARNFFENEVFRDRLPLLAYEAIWALDYEPPTVPFRHDGLNFAVSSVRHYLATRHTHDWLHAYVKGMALSSFVRALDEDAGQTRTLVFSCWCDGGRYRKAWHRRHRHLVVACSPRGRFEKEVWPKVQIAKEDRPFFNFPCKGFKRIVSFKHLVNTIGYLSNRWSRCAFARSALKKKPNEDDYDEDEEDDEENEHCIASSKKHENHFYLFKTLPVWYRLALALQEDGGFQKILYQEFFQNVSIRDLAFSPDLKLRRGRWTHLVGSHADLPRGMVLPVGRGYAPAEPGVVTSHYWCLAEGRKIYFEYTFQNELLRGDAWLKRQAEGGNCFYDAVEHYPWIPRPKMQKELHTAKPLVNEILELREKVSSLKKKRKRETESAREEIGMLRSEKDKLVETMDRMKNKEIDRLEARIKELEKENETLKSHTPRENLNV